MNFTLKRQVWVRSRRSSTLRQAQGREQQVNELALRERSELKGTARRRSTQSWAKIDVSQNKVEA